MSYSSDWVPLVPFSDVVVVTAGWNGERKRFFFGCVMATGGAEWRFWVRRSFVLSSSVLTLGICLKAKDRLQDKGGEGEYTYERQYRSVWRFKMFVHGVCIQRKRRRPELSRKDRAPVVSSTSTWRLAYKENFHSKKINIQLTWELGESGVDVSAGISPFISFISSPFIIPKTTTEIIYLTINRNRTYRYFHFRPILLFY